MKKIIVFIIIIVTAITVTAQNPKNIKIVNVDELFKKGDKYFDQEEYEKSVQQFRKIPEGDSLYDLAQYQLALAYYLQELYDKAAVTLERIIINPSKSVNISSVYNLLSYVYMANNQFDKAINIIEEALILAPYNTRLLSALGKAYTETHQYEKAEVALKKAIFSAPKFQYAHNLLAALYLKEGKTIAAILAYNYSAAINPKTDDAITALKALNELFLGFSDVVENESESAYITPKLLEEDLRFQKLEQLVNSGIGFTKKLKLKTKINHIVTKNNQLVFDNLPDPLNSKDILDYLYIPYFKSMMQMDYNLFCYYLLSGTDIDNNKVEQKAKKMEKKLETIVDHFKTFLEEKSKNGIGIEKIGTDSVMIAYNADEGYLEGIGGYYIKDRLGRIKYQGSWILINENGALNAKVSLVNGKKNGINYFYNDGFLEQQVPYINDSIDGTAYLYYPSLKEENRTINLVLDFKNNKIDGIRKEYNSNCILIEENQYKEGQLNGVSKTFYPQGMIKGIYSNENGNEIGTSKEFSPNGLLLTEYENSSPDVEGKIIKYFSDGSIKLEGSIMNNHFYGTVKSYFPNGKLERVGSYNGNGSYDGFWTDYFSNGTISDEYSYENGILNGEYKTYSNKGFLMTNYKYNKGKIEEITTYMPDNSVRKKITPNEGIFEVDLYDETGTFFLNEFFSTEGELEGISTRYFPAGTIESTTPYKKGEIDGYVSEYFKNGKLKSYIHYKENAMDGLLLRYHTNDTIQEEGLYKNGEPIGVHYTYHINGNPETKIIYQDGNIYSKTEYLVNGIKKYEEIYYNGNLKYVNHYDSNQNIFKVDTFINGNGILKDYYLNGIINTEVKIVANLKIDTMSIYDRQGKLITKINYLNDQIFGNYKPYDQVFGYYRVDGNVIGNNYNGKVKKYHTNGNLYSEENYELGSIEGVTKYYSEENKLSSTHNYFNNLKNGISNYYGDDGKTIVYQCKFKNGNIVAVSSMKNNKPSDFIPVGKDTINLVSYYPDGKKSYEVTFVNGEKSIRQIYYYTNGKISDESSMLNGEYHGKSTEYYSNGNLKTESTYYYDVLNGSYIEYYNNGSKKTEGFYQYGYPHGLFKFYNEKGELIREIDLFYGVIKN
jgi:uncharacterized protein